MSCLLLMFTVNRPAHRSLRNICLTIMIHTAPPPADIYTSFCRLSVRLSALVPVLIQAEEM